MTDLDLAAIKARADAATPGPWYPGEIWKDQVLDQNGFVLAKTYKQRPDAEFIAHARADVPALLARIAEYVAALRRAGIKYPTDPRGIDDLAAMASGRLEELTTALARIAELEAERDGMLRLVLDHEEAQEAQAAEPVKYTAEEMDEIAAEVAAHPRRHVIEAIAETTYEIDNDSTEGGGGGMVYHLSHAYELVDAMPALNYDESVLCDEPGCGAHPPTAVEVAAAAERRGYERAVARLRESDAERFVYEHREQPRTHGPLPLALICALLADYLDAVKESNDG